jgi:hypothetical protein
VHFSISNFGLTLILEYFVRKEKLADKDWSASISLAMSIASARKSRLFDEVDSIRNAVSRKNRAHGKRDACAPVGYVTFGR